MQDTTGTQHVLAADVIAGDRVLGFVDPATGRVIDHPDPYTATPQADKPGCQCPGHESLEDEDRAKTLVVLYDGEIWDYACDVVPADWTIVITARPEPDLRRTATGYAFTHNGRTVHIFRTPGTPSKWSAAPAGCKTIVSHRKTRREAVRAIVRYLNGDMSGRTGFDKLAELLSL